MRRIGITGNIGTGKSSVIRILKELHQEVINVDEMNANLLIKGEPGYQLLIKKYGLILLDVKKQIDKKELAGMIFKDPQIKKEVEGILHPLLKERLMTCLRGKNHDVFVEVPLLFEAGWEDVFDEIWVIVAKKEVVLERLQTKRGMSLEEALLRYETQMSQEEKIKKGHVVIENFKGYKELYALVRKQLKEG